MVEIWCRKEEVQETYVKNCSYLGSCSTTRFTQKLRLSGAAFLRATPCAPWGAPPPGHWATPIPPIDHREAQVGGNPPAKESGDRREAPRPWLGARRGIPPQHSWSSCRLVAAVASFAVGGFRVTCVRPWSGFCAASSDGYSGDIGEYPAGLVGRVGEASASPGDLLG